MILWRHRLWHVKWKNLFPMKVDSLHFLLPHTSTTSTFIQEIWSMMVRRLLQRCDVLYNLLIFNVYHIYLFVCVQCYHIKIRKVSVLKIPTSQCCHWDGDCLSSTSLIRCWLVFGNMLWCWAGSEYRMLYWNTWFRRWRSRAAAGVFSIWRHVRIDFVVL